MKKEIDFFDKPRNVKLMLRVFYVCLFVLLLIDFFIIKHPDFYWEDAPGFFAAYGFLSCVFLIYVARVLRWFVKRDESYYDWEPKRQGRRDRPETGADQGG